ncbi:MAG: alpha/beta hydrolase [Rhodospirillaceae bacterium]|nr:alpha/beta hydrolase [Rhodospirillaceae bacterium]MBT6137856.1 alpha/beta hydrolase [Rhodospirillaceae bacterium]
MQAFTRTHRQLTLPGCHKILVATLVLSLLSACAPRLQQSGTSYEIPHIADGMVVMRDGVRLPLRQWPSTASNAKAAVIALHGFNDYSNAFAELGPALAARGISVFAYDQRGFGAGPGRGIWPGHETMGRDLADMARIVRRLHPGMPVHGLGESMGGAVIMTALASSNRPAIDGAVLSAPAVWGRATMGPFPSGLLAVLAHSVPAVRLSPRGLKIRPSDNIEMLRRLGRDPLFIKQTRIDTISGLVDLMDAALAASKRLRGRLLVLYGEKDEIVPKVPTCLMLGRLARSTGQGSDKKLRLAVYPNGFHMLFRDLNGDQVTSDIASWVLDRSADLPSASERPATQAGSGFCAPTDAK